MTEYLNIHTYWQRNASLTLSGPSKLPMSSELSCVPFSVVSKMRFHLPSAVIIVTSVSQVFSPPVINGSPITMVAVSSFVGNLF